MKKTPPLFQFGPDRKITNQIHPDCLWVARGEGIATEKLDGTNVRLTIRSGGIVRVEARRNPTPAEKEAGIIQPWYRDALFENPADRWIIDAAAGTDTGSWPDGEHHCEAIGPKIQGNPLGLQGHQCFPFNLTPGVYDDAPRGFEELEEYLKNLSSLFSPGHEAEGIVFHHPDGRRAKIRRRDFGYR